MEEAASERMAAVAMTVTRAWRCRSEGRCTASTPPPTKKLTTVTAGMPNPHPHQRADVDGRDAQRGRGEVVEVEDPAALVDEAAAAASSRSGGKGKVTVVEEEEVNGFFVEEEVGAVSNASSIGVASSDSSTGELVIGEGGAFSSLQATFQRK
uniref:Uncharacterized protein n=1 Tax=Oryza glumipatula TaxID=40148 RepID=A0A0E0BJ38_9ORYZ